MHTSFTPFPTLTTPRLVLRELRASDADDIFRLRAEDSVNKYLDGFRHGHIEETHSLIERINKAIAGDESIFWVITLRESGQFIGTICLWNLSRENDTAETGYMLSPVFQHKGYMREALEKVMDYGFGTMKLKAIDAYTHRDNESSRNLLLACNFTHDPLRRSPDNEHDIVFTVFPAAG